jgi:hypothetical protein
VSDDIKCSKEELVSFHIRNVARKMAGLVKEKKPLAGQWYFWTPVGVILAGGGAAVAYVLLNSHASSSPTMQEIQLEVPVQ